MTSTQGEGDNLFLRLYDFFPLWLPHHTAGPVFWKPCWCYIYYTTVNCWQSPLWISTIKRAAVKSSCILHYAKNFLPPLSKKTFALGQSQRTFYDSGGVGCSWRRVFHKFYPHKNVLYCMSASSQDMTLYIRDLIMQTFLRGRAALKDEINSLDDLNLSEESQRTTENCGWSVAGK